MDSGYFLGSLIIIYLGLCIMATLTAAETLATFVHRDSTRKYICIWLLLLVFTCTAGFYAALCLVNKPETETVLSFILFYSNIRMFETTCERIQRPEN
jgi:hypothetical protein